MKKVILATLVLSMAITTSALAAADQKKSIKVGTFSTSAIAGNAGVESLKEMGYDVEVIIFDDAVLPNIALQEGSIDINIYQHTPYLEAFMKNNKGEPLTMMSPLIYFPNYGLYSKKYTKLDELPSKAVIGLYNDASNLDRGLKVLRDAGLVELADKEGLFTVYDIVENPKKLKFYEMSFGTAVRALDDVDASISAASHIQQGGLDPKVALVLEQENNVFACGIAARVADKDSKWLQDVMTAYTSESSREFINDGYKGASVAFF